MPLVEPIFTYHVSGFPGPVMPSDPLWHRKLSDETGAFQVGDYFNSATVFLSRDRHQLLKKGIAALLPGNQLEPEITGIKISLEKHGAFYHPARVTVFSNCQKPLSLVLNTAVSMPGLALIQQEACLLEKLKSKTSSQAIPAVIGAGTAEGPEGEIAFFLAQWFDGFKEFHATGENPGESIGAWESDGRVIPLETPRCYTIYEKAAEILTDLYDINTFAQVFPWHHAAGDFIIKPDKENVDVKLITIRGYGSLIGTNDDTDTTSQEDIWYALLLFLINLSIRMRVDRIDGTGDYVLMNTDIIHAAVQGFCKSLIKQQRKPYFRPQDLNDFKNFLSALDKEEFFELIHMTAHSYNPDIPETKLIIENLNSHGTVLLGAVAEILKTSFFIDNVS